MNYEFMCWYTLARGLLVSWRMEEDVSGGGRLVSSGYGFNAEDSSRSSDSNTSEHTLKARGLY